MYSESVIKRPRGGPDGPPGESTETYMTLSPARSVLGRRKERDTDIFDQQADLDRDLDPKTPTRPRKHRTAPLGTQEDSDMETEPGERTAAEAEAIVVYQLENLRRELQRFSDHHIWGARAMDIAHGIARKFMPELIAAGEKQREDGNADSSRALQETAELRSTVRDLAKVVNTLVARQDVTPTQTGENQGGPPVVQGVKKVIATGPVYRPTKANPVQTRPTTHRQQNNPRSPKDQYHPARLIVIPRGEKFDTNQLNPRRLVNLINDRLTHSIDAKHLCVASAHYNHNQNLVIMLREDQKGEELRQHAEEFIDIFGVPAHTIEMVTDDRRYKVRINGVWTGRDGEGDLNTPEDLLEEIKRFNPVMSKVTLMGKPRWMRAEADLKRKDYSSVVLEFAREEDAKTMLEAKYIAMYTNFCEVVHHADRPPVLQCSKCWALGHHVSRCKNPMRCRICAGGHSETEHRRKNEQRMMDEHEGEEEGNDGQQRDREGAKCANCGGNHPATERSCPERKRHQMIAREKERGEAEGGVMVRKRKGTKKMLGGQGAEREGGNDKNKQQPDTTQTRKNTTQVGRADTAKEASSEAMTMTNRNTNKFMALENLLNQQDNERWEESAMEGQEHTGNETHGNVTSL
ncbi:hypothetical protein C0992_002190 [Termitomyces sp. T32_za158]|nr:hypothetical protein C0992_002190 [Termitomyces sp. T32_za158]